MIFRRNVVIRYGYRVNTLYIGVGQEVICSNTGDLGYVLREPNTIRYGIYIEIILVTEALAVLVICWISGCKRHAISWSKLIYLFHEHPS